MTKKELDFAVFCIENVAERLNINGAEAYKRLSDGGILDDYILPGYEALHTQGKEYIVNDILAVMEKYGLAE